MNIAVDKVFYVRIAHEKPKQFLEYSPIKNFFGGKQGKSLCEVKPHHPAKNRTDERQLFAFFSILLLDFRGEEQFFIRAILKNILEKIEILVFGMHFS